MNELHICLQCYAHHRCYVLKRYTMSIHKLPYATTCQRLLLLIAMLMFLQLLAPLIESEVTCHPPHACQAAVYHLSASLP